VRPLIRNLGIRRENRALFGANTNANRHLRPPDGRYYLKAYSTFFSAFFLPQRAAAALLAIFLRLLGDRASALAFPPLRPPRRPRATAAGFLPASSRPAEVASDTIRAATWFTSLLDRFCIYQCCHTLPPISMGLQFKLTHPPCAFVSCIKSDVGIDLPFKGGSPVAGPYTNTIFEHQVPAHLQSSYQLTSHERAIRIITT